MRLMIILLTVFTLQATATGYGQRLSVSYNNTPLEQVFKDITAKTGYLFFYSFNELHPPHTVTVQKQNSTLQEILAACFKSQPYTWQVIEKTVVVKYVPPKQETPPPTPYHDVRGKVINDKGEPVAGATITVKGTRTVVTANASGEFSITGIAPDAVLVVSAAELETQEVAVGGKQWIEINAIARVSEIDQVLVQAYGTTTRRFATANISKVTAKEIEIQPVTNPLSALQGRVAGLTITHSTGLPGASVSVQLRGRTAIDVNLTDDQPLFVIDGVPYAPNNGYLNNLTSALGVPNPSVLRPGGLSPFNSINPQDIESIEVLKDADATAIYGSRGANGVILITTKSGKEGKTKFSVNIQHGFSKLPATTQMLNTEQYISMRKEAFANDGVTPNNTNAYDLRVWDTLRYTNFNDLLLGGTANRSNIQTSLSGGNTNTQFLLGMNYNRETTVFPDDYDNKRGNFHFTVTHGSNNKKFKTQLSGTYTIDNNQVPGVDLTNYINLPPNVQIFGSDGKLAWNEGGLVITGLTNPLAYLNQRYFAKTNNLVSNLLLSYNLFPSTTIRVSTGYNFVALSENRRNPLTAQNPLQNPVRTSQFSDNSFNSWIVEPQLEFQKSFKVNKINILLGSTWQSQVNKTNSMTGIGYISDLLMESLNGAASITGNRSENLYKYSAVFGRLNYQLLNRYILNLTARRDGSSRFGPDKRFSNFGSIGAAWIFSNEKFLNNISFLNFGKLRGSYGVTGNDKITNYLYLDTWSPSFNPYNSRVGLTPTRLFNPDYHWEKTTKFELAVDLSLFNERVSITVAHYRNKSSNQLVNYRMPLTTGFTSIVRNMPAVVQNTGTEVELSLTLISRKDVSWKVNSNITVPRNKLVSFPNLASSPYAFRYFEGESLNVLSWAKYLGVDPATGLFMVEDVNGNGTITAADYQPLGTLDPKYYGGINNAFTIRSFELEVFFHYTKQTGRNFLNDINLPPGNIANLPAQYNGYWKNGNTDNSYQRLTQATSASGPAYASWTNFRNSSGVFSDASFIRLKNVMLAYNFRGRILQDLKLTNCRFYILGNNLFTITNYKVGDPETQTYLRMPPLRNISFGAQITF